MKENLQNEGGCVMESLKIQLSDFNNEIVSSKINENAIQCMKNGKKKRMLK